MARRMETRQSSTDPSYAESFLAVDGAIQSIWDPLAVEAGASVSSTRTTFEVDPWWEVDLGRIAPISQIVLYPFTGQNGRPFCGRATSSNMTVPEWAGDLYILSKTEPLLQLQDPFVQSFEITVRMDAKVDSSTTVIRKTLDFSCANGVTSIAWNDVFARGRFVRVQRIGGDNTVLMLNEVHVVRWNPAVTPQFVLVDLRGTGELPMALSGI
jgi:hypothetical protein